MTDGGMGARGSLEAPGKDVKAWKHKLKVCTHSEGLCPQCIALGDDAEAGRLDASNGETAGRFGETMRTSGILDRWKCVKNLLAEHWAEMTGGGEVSGRKWEAGVVAEKAREAKERRVKRTGGDEAWQKAMEADGRRRRAATGHSQADRGQSESARRVARVHTGAPPDHLSRFENTHVTTSRPASPPHPHVGYRLWYPSAPGSPTSSPPPRRVWVACACCPGGIALQVNIASVQVLREAS